MSTATRHYDTILGPVITEKTTLLSEDGKVAFFVPLTANKKDIAIAVEELFKVEVTAVNTIRVHGKSKRFRGIAGKRNDQKKAIVTLKEGHSIDVTTGLS
jgi:large subunit ribosomal protein L23